MLVIKKPGEALTKEQLPCQLAVITAEQLSCSNTWL